MSLRMQGEIIELQKRQQELEDDLAAFKAALAGDFEKVTAKRVWEDPVLTGHLGRLMDYLGVSRARKKLTTKKVYPGQKQKQIPRQRAERQAAREANAEAVATDLETEF